MGLPGQGEAQASTPLRPLANPSPSLVPVRWASALLVKQFQRQDLGWRPSCLLPLLESLWRGSCTCRMRGLGVRSSAAREVFQGNTDSRLAFKKQN